MRVRRQDRAVCGRSIHDTKNSKVLLWLALFESQTSCTILLLPEHRTTLINQLVSSFLDGTANEARAEKSSRGLNVDARATRC